MASPSAARAEPSSFDPPPVGLGGGALAKDAASALGQADARRFEALYDEHFGFVWRSLRRLGVADSAIDDAVQDVFLVVHRRLAEFEGRATVKTWLFGIVLRVARTHRRAAQRRGRKEGAAAGSADPEVIAGPRGEQPDARTEQAEAVRALHGLLDQLDEEKREVFVLAELEQMSAPAIAEVLGINVNTIYSRLRAARQEFEQAVARYQARSTWRSR